MSDRIKVYVINNSSEKWLHLQLSSTVLVPNSPRHSIFRLVQPMAVYSVEMGLDRFDGYMLQSRIALVSDSDNARNRTEADIRPSYNLFLTSYGYSMRSRRGRFNFQKKRRK
jgi:hypothetical protein